MWELTLVLALVLVVVVWLGNKRYQALQKQNHAIWLQVEAQLNRRYDWVPLWIKTAKSILEQEISALKAVIEARQAAARALKNIKQKPEHSPAMQEWLRAEAHFTQSLRECGPLCGQLPTCTTTLIYCLCALNCCRLKKHCTALVSNTTKLLAFTTNTGKAFPKTCWHRFWDTIKMRCFCLLMKPSCWIRLLNGLHPSSCLCPLRPPKALSDCLLAPSIKAVFH